MSKQAKQSSDWTCNWEANVATKVTAIVLWSLIALVFTVTFIIAAGLKDRIAAENNVRADHIAYRINLLLAQSKSIKPAKITASLAVIRGGDFSYITLSHNKLVLHSGIPFGNMKAIVRTVRQVDPKGRISSYKLSLFSPPLSELVISQRNNILLLALVVILLFSMFISRLVKRFLDKPVQEMIGATRKVADGDLDARLSMNRKDEFGYLSTFFNSMLDNISRHETQLRDALQRAESANAAKSAFLANMSHEIRTPMTAIIGFAESTLADDLSKEQQTGALKTIIKSGHHLLHIINEVLDLSKIEAGKFRLVEEPFKQVLLNLGNNAVKFTEQGEITFYVSYDSHDNRIHFSVTDTGIGVSKDKQEHIFDAFSQEDSSTTRRFGGTGLGLFLTRRLVQLMGGEISMTSDYGHGSHFIVSLDAGNTEDVETIFSESEIPDFYDNSVADLPDRFINGRVLVAEDTIENQMLLSLYLEKMGLDVRMVENGYEAVEEAGKENFDLVIMDMQMPVMDGLRATEVLRKKGIEWPIIALTANAMREDRERCLAAGCNNFITKPIDRKMLFEVLQRYLSEPQRAVGQ